MRKLNEQQQNILFFFLIINMDLHRPAHLFFLHLNGLSLAYFKHIYEETNIMLHPFKFR